MVNMTKKVSYTEKELIIDKQKILSFAEKT